ncbi:MAG: PilT/PilU family type 4a pilus ATPase [Chloroflexi bacterium]|nr:PilT/PilU family type 4a pilus ATPase [Chloroflexota bacterium]
MVGLARERQASDLHLTPGYPPMLRIHGHIVPLEGSESLTPPSMVEALAQIANKEQLAEFEREMELDMGCNLSDGSRIRCNAARQRSSISMAIRLLPPKVPSIEELGLPEVCKDLALKPRGLVIISGPTGSGKSTTLASMIHYLNAIEKRRIVTVEDPIEYIYPTGTCSIVQRELGTDTTSFANALKHVLRQDPDVILVGEMRDSETASAVLTVADTGHLVLTTGHAPSASQAVERVIDLFPPHERHLAQARLASLLLGVFCQALVPKADGTGRVAAVEIMLANPAVKNLIREGKIYQLPNIIQTHASEGMQLLDRVLVNLYLGRTISYESMMAFCNDRNEVERLTGRPPEPIVLKVKRDKEPSRDSQVDVGVKSN